MGTGKGTVGRTRRRLTAAENGEAAATGRALDPAALQSPADMVMGAIASEVQLSKLQAGLKAARQVAARPFDSTPITAALDTLLRTVEANVSNGIERAHLVEPLRVFARAPT